MVVVGVDFLAFQCVHEALATGVAVGLPRLMLGVIQ
jgi:hypothetical protein